MDVYKAAYRKSPILRSAKVKREFRGGTPGVNGQRRNVAPVRDQGFVQGVREEADHEGIEKAKNRQVYGAEKGEGTNNNPYTFTQHVSSILRIHL